jgi:hypothetical protein
MCIFSHNASHPFIFIGSGAGWVVCGQFCFDWGDSWDSRAAEVSEHSAAPLSLFLAFWRRPFVVGCVLNPLRWSAGRICNANLGTPCSELSHSAMHYRSTPSVRFSSSLWVQHLQYMHVTPQNKGHVAQLHEGSSTMKYCFLIYR